MRKNQGLQRMLLSYLPLFLLVVSLLVLIFMLVVTQVVQKENERANANYASYIMQTLDNQVQVIEQAFLRDIYFHQLMPMFFNPTFVQDAEVHYQLSRELQNFVQAYTLIDSVYVYRDSDSRVLSNSVMIDVQRYGDADFIRKAPFTQQEGRWGSARVFMETGNTGGKVISSVREYKIGRENVGFLVVNLSVYRLHQLYQRIGEVDFSRISVHDASGQWLTGDTGAGEADLTLKSEVTGWSISSSLNRYHWLGAFQSVSSIWIVAVVAIILLGVGWLILVTRKHYKPIEALTARLESFSLQKSMQLNGNYNEFHFIESALNELLEEAQTYSRKLNDTHAIRENALFQDLICGSPIAAGDIKTTLAAKGIDGRGVMALLQLEADGHHEFEQTYSQRDQNLLKFSLKCVIREMGEKHALNVWTEWIGEKHIGVLLQHADATLEAGLEAYSSELLQWVESHLSFTITLAHGGWVRDYSQLYLAYETSTELLHMKASLGNNRQIAIQDVDTANVLGYYQLIPDVHVMTDAFKLGKEEWRKHYAVMHSRIRMHAMARQELVQLFEYMLHKLNSDMRETAETDIYWNELALAEMREWICRFDTVEELFTGIGHVLSGVYGKMLAWREANGKHAMLDKAKAYVETSFHDPDLSLQGVSEAFGMSQTQFSQLFKRGVGEKFVDYVTRLRIDEAKQQLSESEKPIQDIAQAVGYIHAVSFNRAFKKMVGQTPGDYRRENNMARSEAN